MVQVRFLSKISGFKQVLVVMPGKSDIPFKICLCFSHDLHWKSNDEITTKEQDN